MYLPANNNSSTSPPRAPARGTGGFTLIEVMLALTITAIVSAMLWGVWGDTTRAMVRMEKVTVPSRTAQQIIAALTTDLESCFIPNQSKLAFYATQDDRAVRFLSMADSAVMLDGRQGDSIEVAYKAYDTGDGISLYRRESPYIDARPLEGGEYKLLARQLADFSLEFYDGQEWLPYWNNLGTPDIENRDKGLPRAIRITVAINEQVNKTGSTTPRDPKQFRYTTVIRPISSLLTESY